MSPAVEGTDDIHPLKARVGQFHQPNYNLSNC